MLAQQSWKWSAYAMGEEGFLRDGQLSMWGAAARRMHTYLELCG